MNNTIAESTSTLKISEQGYPLPIEMRPLWRISLIIISLNNLKDKNSQVTINKIKVAVWMLIRKQQWAFYVERLTNKDTFDISIDRSDEKAIELCLAKNLILIEDSRLSLTELGISLNSLISEENILTSEVDFLQSISSSLTNTAVSKILGE
ncbi:MULTISPECIES: hypothetical protein [unclassified Pseudomonas]|uniref:hypothetical protein n=1 Tax=unclassified Pseudomonas TaxID=196821 RepID=UPI000CCFECEE|nr:MULTISPECIES: hypothetical protein [unclassified Pseudomonas]POA29119.1 hypothetical protein C1887_20735 [Pseudomonas sp. GW456-R21]POA62986.1 hypothetical protein C1884_25905 [Pseudomonas sp. GW460-R15]